ncbi:HupE/UreJ family protein [Verminephrobacter aporrectodeae]|uniref:HupE/UreJ family protein n=1 Tax=Verminephrobacter aporrectodeae TaxID=1110389 RepID=UPI0002377A7A|nr:HupE/UreJ family protein [Verminephrobacter aporrectodeae]MCW8165166.1 urease accessory protein UreJ [Verminephrobacter aporrectodeae subsp. tuberculatae]MCW8168316.1 urease accessory protein UreJ [Verminephrobacter aporrectodeae subsp. tuberculatae]MCW8175826.1 urease accessory protein UreJ [Verminephrobacter aporrectodeae subsp. tuberculatae]MCW8203463.1 urease accessory protein UreJ [Verminephrobacter aporrectodeae subsp. tuberculatae]
MHFPRIPRPASAMAFLALGAMGSNACAHGGHPMPVYGSFFDGFMHPLSGPDHLAAMLAVGLWSALSARRAGAQLLWAPAGFAALLLAGAVLGLRGAATAAVEPMIATSLLLGGLLLASRLRMPGPAAALGVGVFALFHGLAHGHELAGGGSAWQTLAGMLAATALLHCVGLAAGWTLRRRGAWLARAAGAGVAALGAAQLLQLA